MLSNYKVDDYKTKLLCTILPERRAYVKAPLDAKLLAKLFSKVTKNNLI